MLAGRNPLSASSPEMPRQTLDGFGLGGVNCSLCGNTGYIVEKIGAYNIKTTECPCMKRRRSLRRIQKSGLSDMLSRCTFHSFETPDAGRRLLKEKAMEYADGAGQWWFLTGRSGSGKTHLCTAICGALIERGADVRYIVWKDFAQKAKGSANRREEYAALVEPLKTVDVLYLDDFFKVKDNDPALITPGDVNLAFEILNARYLDARKRTLLSAEMDAETILQIDEALGGRIVERAGPYYLESPAENWRLRG